MVPDVYLAKALLATPAVSARHGSSLADTSVRVETILDPGGTSGVRPEHLGIGQLFWIVQEAAIAADADSGRIVLWNPAAEHLFGYSAAEVSGRCLEELLIPTSAHDQFAAALRQ